VEGLLFLFPGLGSSLLCGWFWWESLILYELEEIWVGFWTRVKGGGEPEVS
jgi:hypothetical protein